MLRYLNGVENIKDYVIKYLTYIFLAEEKGQITFYDGNKLLKFSQRPTIIKKNQWDFRKLPCLLISASGGELQQISIEKDFLGSTVDYTIGTDAPGPSGTDFYEAGGEINLDMTIDVWAFTAEERDKLLDLVSVYLSNPTAKNYMLRNYIRLPTNIRITEGGAANLPNIETPVYYSTVRFDAVGTWRDREYYGAKLSEILFNLEFKESLIFSLSSVRALDYNTIQLVFSDALYNNSALVDISNYIFSGSTTISASSITIVNSTTININISGEMKENGSYLVKVTGIQNSDNTTINPENGKGCFLGIGILPRVSSVEAKTYATIDVTFNRKMKNDSNLTTASNYVFSGPTSITSTSVSRINDYTVRVTISGEMSGGELYTATVSNVFDSIGNPIDTDHDSGTFLGIGVPPLLFSATSLDTATVRVVYSEDMSDTGLTTPANYVFTCPSSAPITSNIVTKVNSTTVDITVSGEMLTGTDNYTITISNVTDVAGNPIDPLHDTATFNGIGIAPQVSSATSLDAYTVRVVFNEGMSDTGLTTPANYVFTCPSSAPITSNVITKVNSTTVDITISGEMLTGTSNYTVTISNVTDIAGNVIDPAFDNADFNGIGIAPQVSSATSLDAYTVRIVFNESMSDTGLTTTTNYTFTGSTAITSSLVTKINSTTVDVTVTGEMLTGTNNYTATVNNVIDVAGNVIDPAHNSDTFNGIGIAPQVSSATSLDNATVRIVFNENMSDTGLTTAVNYTFTCPIGATITSSVVTKINSTTVDVTISGEMLTGTNNYTAIVNNVTDTVGNVIDPAHNSDTFNGIGIAPQVSSATSLDTTTIRIIFNENMSDTGLTTSTNYTFTCPVTAPITSSVVTKINSTTVDITISGEMLTGTNNYTAIVNNVTDSVGNVIDPAHNSDTFNGIGVQPQVSSATSLDAYTVRIVFNEAMSDTGLTTAINYTFTCPPIAPITSNVVTKINSTTVDVTISGEMLTGTNNYTAIVNNVTDVAGNSIDPAHNSDTFDGIGIQPQVSSATSTDAYTVRIIFNENMSDTGLTTATNYTFTCPPAAPITSSVVTKINATTVDITISGEMLTGTNNYTAIVNNVTDAIGNIIDPAHNSDTFDGIGIAPYIFSASYVDPVTCTVTFSENMDSTSTQTIGNYAFSGPNTPNVTNAVLAGATVTLTLDTVLTSGLYSISVSNVTDLIGNMISPNPDTEALFVSVTGILLFGGYDTNYDDETWKWNGTVWVQKSPATSPDARRTHNIAYDSSTNTGIIFGGYNGGELDDTWEWNGVTWTEKFPVSKPGARHYHVMDFDISRNVVVLFGGDIVGGTSDETWEYDGTNWTQKFPLNKPSARRGAAMVYDSSRNVSVLFGGYNGSYDNETWEWNGTNWTQKFPATSPSTRYAHDMAFDSSRNVIVLFGGEVSGGAVNDETWEYNGTTWTQKFPASKPSARRLHSMAFDSSRNVSVLFGGRNGVYNDETWEWDGTNWTQKASGAVTKPSARLGHAMSIVKV